MKLLAFDLETHLVQEGLAFPPIVCGSWASGIAGQITASLDREPVSSFEYYVTKDSVVWCGANIAFDFGCVLAVRPDLFPQVWNLYKEGRVFDVSIAATLNAIYDGRLKDGELWRRDGTRNQRGRYSLEEVVYECTGRKTAKENDRFRKSYALLEHLPTEEWPEDARQYPVDDARNTLECAEYQARNYRNLQDMPRQCWAAFAMKLGSAWGMRTDPMAYELLATNIDDMFVKLEGAAAANGLMRAKVKKRPEDLSKDMAAIKERVFQAYDGQPPVTPTGETSTAREALLESGDPALESLAEMGKWAKLKTYLPMLLQGTSAPINISPNSLVATGRASYEGLIQLIPKKGGVRQVFRARPGYVWSSVDYAAIEMSTLAQVHLWLLGESTLADSINSGIDPHWLFGSQLLGVDYASTLAAAKAEDTYEATIRFASKAANFGFPGMMGPAKFVIAKRHEGLKVCEWFHRDGKCGETKVREWGRQVLDAPLCRRCIEEAAKLRNQFITTWREMRPYWNKVTSLLDANGDRLEHFVSKRIRGGLSAPAGANTLFQGLAADGAKAAVIALTEEMYLDTTSPLFGSRLMVFAHDETILEIPEEKAHEAALRQAEVMITQMKLFVPDVKVKAEPALMLRWDKDAKAVYKEGRLIPWHPSKT